MSGASEAAAALLKSALAPYGAAKSATSHYGLAVARLQAASDLMDVLQAAGGLVLAAEALGDVISGHAQTLRVALTNALADTGAVGVRTETHTVSLATKPARVDVREPELVPPHLLTAPRPDLVAIAKELRAGRPVPGCVLVGNGEPTVRFHPRKE
jgi:hypothetical protein